jgi:hypothetical protein
MRAIFGVRDVLTFGADPLVSRLASSRHLPATGPPNGSAASSGLGALATSNAGLSSSSSSTSTSPPPPSSPSADGDTLRRLGAVAGLLDEPQSVVSSGTSDADDAEHVDGGGGEHVRDDDEVRSERERADGDGDSDGDGG